MKIKEAMKLSQKPLQFFPRYTEKIIKTFFSLVYKFKEIKHNSLVSVYVKETMIDHKSSHNYKSLFKQDYRIPLFLKTTRKIHLNLTNACLFSQLQGLWFVRHLRLSSDWQQNIIFFFFDSSNQKVLSFGTQHVFRCSNVWDQ